MNAQSASNNPSLRLLVGFAAFVIIIAGVKQAVDIVVPLLMAIFVAIISQPGVVALRRRGVPIGLALMLVITLVLGIAFAFGILIGTSADSFVAQIPTYEQQINRKFGGLLTWFGETFDLPVDYNLIQEIFSPGTAVALVGNFVNGLSGLLTNAFLIMVTAAFLLLEADQVPSKLRRILQRPESTLDGLRDIGLSVNSYLVTKTAISAVTGVFIGCWLWFFDIDFPVLWGLVAFALNFIPNIGSILAAIPAVLLALVQHGLSGGLVTGLGYLLVNTVIGNIVEPRVMGARLGLSTLVVFCSLIFWGWVLGPVGMFLSIPLTMTVKIALQNSEGGNWLAVLLGSGTPEVFADAGLRPDFNALPEYSDKNDTA
ncbi:AI-2E family transporter [Gammaproteobacteria bacterium]|nr:AI-2E family transporter [Gammaproteobacteria bacterium]